MQIKMGVQTAVQDDTMYNQILLSVLVTNSTIIHEYVVGTWGMILWIFENSDVVIIRPKLSNTRFFKYTF